MEQSSQIHIRRVVIVFLIITIITVCISIAFLFWLHNAFIWKVSADFETYADDFNVVKNFIQEEFPNESNKCLLVSTSGGQGIRLFDLDTDEYLQVPEDVLSSLERIDKEGFPDLDADLSVIRIHEDRVSFESGSYALVYSPSQKPSWLKAPGDTEVKVKVIGDGWYHVTKKR